MADVVVDAKTVDQVKTRIINEVRTYGKVPKRVPIQNEELKLADYAIEPETKVTKAVTMDTRKKSDKSSTKAKAAKHVNTNSQKKQTKQQISGLSLV